MLIGVYMTAICYQSYIYPALLFECVYSGGVITFDEYNYKVVESGFVSEKDVERFWENMKVVDYRIHISRYPIIKEIQL